MKLRERKQLTAEHKIGSGEDKRSAFEAPRRGNLVRFILPAAVFCWPIIYLFRHVFPIHDEYTAIGNDFIVLYYKYKVYLLAHLCNFSFPLWSPSEGAGFPFYTNPFAQAFYPFNLPLAVWYKVLDGYNPLDHQIFTVLGISIFALGLFMWLRLLNNNIRAVLFAVLVMSVSFKMTEIMRFPNAVHTAAWYPWVFYAVTRIMLSRSWKKAAWYGGLLMFFLICLCTGGYPYYAYYSQFLFVPYFLVFVIKPLRVRLIGTQPINWKRALATLATVGLLAGIICAPYALGVKQLMSETTDRAGKDFTYSTAHEFSFEDTLGSLFYPPAAMQDGWNFFGITAILVILLYMLSPRPGRTSCRIAVDMKTGKDKSDPAIPLCWCEAWVKLFFIVWISTIIYISYGYRSYLFILLWKFMPGFWSLRVWPRLNITLVPIFAWLLSLAYASFEWMILDKETEGAARPSRFFSPIAKVLAVYAIILGIQLYLYLNNIYDPYWLHYFNHLSSRRILFIVFGAVGFASVLSILMLRKSRRLGTEKSLVAVLALLFLISILEMRHTGIHIWTHPGKTQKSRIQLTTSGMYELSFRVPRTDYDNSISLGPNFSVGILENWYFRRYVKFLKESEYELEARRLLLGVQGGAIDGIKPAFGGQDGRKIFFSESIEHSTVQSFLRDALRYRDTGRLLSYTGDELRWEIDAPANGYLSFIDNWDWGWEALVDGEPAQIELLFGTFKSVRLTPGRHYVRFHYRPWVLSWSKKGTPLIKTGEQLQ